MSSRSYIAAERPMVSEISRRCAGRDVCLWCLEPTIGSVLTEQGTPRYLRYRPLHRSHRLLLCVKMSMVEALLATIARLKRDPMGLTSVPQQSRHSLPVCFGLFFIILDAVIE